MLTNEGYNDLDKTYKATIYYCWLNPPEFTNKENSRNHAVPKSNAIKLLQHEAVLWDSKSKVSDYLKFVTPQLLPSYKLQANHQIQSSYDNYHTNMSSVLSRQSIRITSFMKINMKVLRIMNVLTNEYK